MLFSFLSFHVCIAVWVFFSLLFFGSWKWKLDIFFYFGPQKDQDPFSHDNYACKKITTSRPFFGLGIHTCMHMTCITGFFIMVCRKMFCSHLANVSFDNFFWEKTPSSKQLQPCFVQSPADRPPVVSVPWPPRTKKSTRTTSTLWKPSNTTLKTNTITELCIGTLLIHPLKRIPPQPMPAPPHWNPQHGKRDVYYFIYILYVFIITEGKNYYGILIYFFDC